MNNKITRRVAAVAGVAGAAVMGLSALGAGGAAAGPLPGAHANQTLVDGTNVDINLFDESVNIQGAMTNVPTSREVWMSGKVAVEVNGAAKGGKINAGYMVGCQVDFGATAGAGTGPITESTTPENTTAAVTGGFTLGPGEAAYFPIIATRDRDKDEVNNYSFTGNRGGVAYSQERFTLDGCAGYAEARAKVQVVVDTDSVKGVVTAYGAPFSIG